MRTKRFPVTISTTVSEGLYESLCRASKKLDRSSSSLQRQAIAFYLESLGMDNENKDQGKE